MSKKPVAHLAADGVNALGVAVLLPIWCGIERTADTVVVLAAANADCKQCKEARRLALPGLILASQKRAASNPRRAKHARDLERLRLARR